MICPNCPGNVEMVKIDEDHSQCPLCNGQWWEPDKPERGEYQKHTVNIKNSMFYFGLAESTHGINHKPVDMGGEPCHKGGSKSGKRRKKPVKRDIRVVYET
jgi:Zn-finger nucleic acid-binding protein